MAKCINCGAQNADYIHVDGGKICKDCIGRYFSCPDCGIVYDMDDYERADQGNGFCKECAWNH